MGTNGKIRTSEVDINTNYVRQRGANTVQEVLDPIIRVESEGEIGFHDVNGNDFSDPILLCEVCRDLGRIVSMIVWRSWGCLLQLRCRSWAMSWVMVWAVLLQLKSNRAKQGDL